MHAAGIDLRRRLEKKRLQVASQLLQLIVDPHERVGVLRGNLAKFSHGAIALSPLRDHLPIGERHLNRGIARHHAKPVRQKIEIADNFRPQHAGNVRSGRDAAGGGNLLGDAAAADDRPAFEDECGHSGARQIGGRGESIMAAANHNRVVMQFRVESQTSRVTAVARCRG